MTRPPRRRHAGDPDIHHPHRKGPEMTETLATALAAGPQVSAPDLADLVARVEVL